MKKIFIFSLLSIVVCVSTASAKRLSIAVHGANVRSGPGTGHKILWSVGKYYPVDTMKRSGNWYKVSDFEGDMGWIHQSLLNKTLAVIVKRTLVNVRKGPGTNFRVLFRAEKGVSFRLLRTKGKWLKVRHEDGDEGWIHGNLVWGR